MKHTAIIVSVFTLFLFLSTACKKNSAKSYPIDTIAYAFNAGGFSYKSFNTFSLNPDSPQIHLKSYPTCVWQQAVLDKGYVFTLSAQPLDSAGDFLNLQMNVDPRAQIITVGTYAYTAADTPLVHEPSNITVGGLFAEVAMGRHYPWTKVISDTITITRIYGTQADGTFSATLGGNVLDTAYRLYVTAGTFKGIPLFPQTN